MRNISIAAWNQDILNSNLLSNWSLGEKLKAKGVQLVPLGTKGVDLHVELEFCGLRSILRCLKFSRQKRILVSFEPKSVNPLAHKKIIHKLFGSVFVMHKAQLIIDTDRVLQFGFFNSEDKPHLPDYESWEKRPNEICLINANKLSFVKGNLYNVRRKYSRGFSKSKIQIHIFGSGWEKNMYLQFLQQLGSITRLMLKFLTLPSLKNFFMPLTKNPYLYFMGTVKSKYETYKNYKFALVIENDPRFVSEKIFDAILGGTVPLFIGGSLEDFGIPKNMAIEIPEKFSRFDLDIMQNKSVIQGVLDAGNQWISSTQTFEYWMIDSGINRLVDGLIEHMNFSEGASLN